MICTEICCVGGRDSSVGIATRYGLDGPGIESRWGARFSAPVRTGPGAYPASYTMGSGPFPAVKRPGRGADHPPPSKCRGQERVGLYLCSPSGPSWPVMGAPLPLPLLKFALSTVCSRHSSTPYVGTGAPMDTYCGLFVRWYLEHTK